MSMVKVGNSYTKKDGSVEVLVLFRGILGINNEPYVMFVSGELERVNDEICVVGGINSMREFDFLLDFA